MAEPRAQSYRLHCLLWRLPAKLATAAIVCAFASFGAGESLAGELDALRSSVRASETPKEAEESPKKKKKKSSGYYDCDNDDEDASENGEALVAVLTSPWWVPAEMIGSRTEAHFSDYPYQFQDGYLVFDRTVENIKQVDDWAGRVSVEYGDDYDNISLLGGDLVFESTTPIAVDASWRMLEEDLLMGGNDELWIGDVNIVIRFAQTETIQMYSGLGANWMHDQYGTEWGWNFTYGGNWFPIQPLVFSSAIDLGSLGDATLFHFRTTAGITYHGVETYIGYDHLSVGGAEFNNMIAGLRIWF